MSCQQLVKRFCRSTLQHEVFTPPIRSKLYVSSAKVFQAFHEDVSKQEFSTIAKQYSTIIRDQVTLIEQFYGANALEERAVYQQLERLWTLCQIVYFPDSKDKSVSLQLMDWYNKSYKPYFLEFDQQAIYFSTSPIQHADFWPFAARLAMFGQTSQLSSLFGHIRSDEKIKSYKAFEKFMEGVQDFTSQGIDYVRSHHDKLRDLMNTLSRIESTLPIPVKKMMDILNILMGDEKTIVNHAKDHIHAFIACNYYNGENTSTLHERAHHFFAAYTMSDSHHENQVMRRFLCGDVHEGLELCAQYDWWIIAHLSDLLSAKERLNKLLYYPIEDGTTISMCAREYFMLTYGSYLINQFDLWEESFIYLMTCGSIGKEAVIEHLTNMDIQHDDTKLNQIVNFCINYSMKNSGLVLYEKKATVCLESKDYKKALDYYRQAEKYQYLDQVFQAVLKDYVHTGKLYDIKAFSSTTNNYNGIHYIVCRDISIINTFYLEGEFQLSANIFKELIQNENIPKNILVILFCEGWKLMDKKIYFSLRDLLEMKKIWIKLKGNCLPSDFTWYHYYKNSNSITIEKEEVSKHVLLQDMTEFFDTSAIIISKSIDYQQQQKNT